MWQMMESERAPNVSFEVAVQNRLEIMSLWLAFYATISHADEFISSLPFFLDSTTPFRIFYDIIIYRVHFT